MGLLHDIQANLLSENTKISPILLKLRFLADRLGSNVLEDWVRLEADGYPDPAMVPDYRKTGISYKGTFSDGYRTLNGISIPLHLIEQHANEKWISYGISDPLPSIEAMIEKSDKSSGYGIDASNLKLLLEGKIYPGYGILELEALIDVGAFVRIVSVVRSKLLDFALELERKVPISASIVVGAAAEVTSVDTDRVTSITQNIFNASVHNIMTAGTASPINVTVVQGDVASLQKALSALGLSVADAKELALIAAEEKPMDSNKAFGVKAAKWVGSRLSEGVDGVLKIGGKVLEADIAKLFQQFYDHVAS